MAHPPSEMSLDDYLALPIAEGPKGEWVKGRAYAMAGGRPRRALVSNNIGIAIGRRLDASPCTTLSPDQRVAV